MKEILADELIGLDVEVVECSDSTKIGLIGKVIDETLKTLIIETEYGKKTIAKKECIFCFEYKKQTVYVDGKMIQSRPEDRIKKAKHLSRKWRLPKFFFRK